MSKSFKSSSIEPVLVYDTLPKQVHPKAIDPRDYPENARTNLLVPIYGRATGSALRAPFVIARGKYDGPILGITAAVHGNELNGIKIIHRLLEWINLDELRGALLCAPVVNVPGFDMGTRHFTDGVDLNNIFPGKSDGTPSEQYARAFCSTFLPAIDYLIDIHTASAGRLNSLYVRVDLRHERSKTLALLLDPEIILHSPTSSGTLRSVALRQGIPAATLEAGNPSVIQGKMVYAGELGIRNILAHLDMLDGSVQKSRNPIICESSKWLRTTGGGILQTDIRLLEQISKKQVVASTYDSFGNLLQEYTAPYDGVVIGRAAYPVSIPGTRFCHLGKLEASGDNA